MHRDQIHVSEENLAVASAKLTAATNKMNREVAKREQFQEIVNQLEQQLVSEKRRISSEHQDEVKGLKATWEDEKNLLLDVIQHDCNLVFEEKRNESVNERSPRSVDFKFSKTKHVLTHSLESQDTADVSKSKSTVYSPKIDAELRETEALVQSLIVGEIRGNEQ